MKDRLPKGWNAVKIGDIAREVSDRNDSNSDLPVLSVTKYDGFVPSLEYFKKQVFSRDTATYKVVRRGQFAYATIHLDEGSVDLLEREDSGLISPMYTVFEPDTRKVDSIFLRYQMKSPEMIRTYGALGQGSINRRKSISFGTLAGLVLLLPPLPEQRKIAAILASVDGAIRATQAVVEQARTVKQGLLQELLTRGIGHTRFKQTEIGEVPEGWEVVELGSLLDYLGSGISRPFSEHNIGVPVLRSGNVQNGRIVLDELKYWYEEDPRGANLITVEAHPGDVLINFVNGSREHLGKAVLYRGELPRCIVSTNFFIVRTKTYRLLPEFLHAYLQSDAYRTWLSEVTGFSGPGSFNQKQLKGLMLPVPPVSEQRAATESLRSLETSLDDNSATLERLSTLKAGLMQVLLTGRVRVKPDA